MVAYMVGGGECQVLLLSNSGNESCKSQKGGQRLIAEVKILPLSLSLPPVIALLVLWE